MNLRERKLRVVEFAPSLYLTEKGEWTVEPPSGARIIGRLGLPPADIGTKQKLLSDETKQKIIDKLGLSGDTKELFSNAWDIGSMAVAGYGYYVMGKELLKLIGALPTYESPEMKALKYISYKIEEAVNLLKLESEIVIATKVADIENARQNLEDGARAFLNSQTSEEWEDLRLKLEALTDALWAQLFNPTISLSYMKTGWDPHNYAGTDWYYMMWMWGFEQSAFAPAEKEEIPVLGTLKQGVGRWDYRPWIGILAKSVVTLLIGHVALDPACRTTGVYRSRLKGFAEGLRLIARRMIAGVQVTRPLDLHKWSTQYKSGYGIDEWGYDILADGWPVGAVDSVSGAAAFDAAWKPSENGFPVLATIKKVNLGEGEPPIARGDPPPMPWTFAYFGAIKQAAIDRDKDYFALTSSLPVIELYGLADDFDDLATPPKKSETVSFEGPAWVGVRVPAGTKQIEVGGGEFCEKKVFTADVFHARRTATVQIKVQPKLFQWGSHRIDYKVYLDSSDLSSPGPYGGAVDRKALEPGTGTVYLECWMFDWEIQKPLSISDQFSDESVVYVFPSSLPLNQANDFHFPAEGLKVGSVAMQLPTGQFALADTPLEQRKGRVSPTHETKTLPFHYERTDEDGLLTIVLKIDMGQRNSLVRLVVEEPIGFPTPDPPLTLPAPKILRSAVPLAMIGIEHYLPQSYFAHRDFCNEQSIKSLAETFHVAQGKGVPVPYLDPRVDPSYADYVLRAQKEVRDAVPERGREVPVPVVVR